MERRKACPGDISREQFERIRPLLESVRRRARPRTVDLYEVFNAVLHLLKSGCQWRMPPEGFPSRVTVYSYFARWSAVDRHGVSALERALKKIGWRGPHQTGAQTSFVIVDAQSVKNTDTAEEKGCDAGKKVSGIRRHIAVDTRGLPHAVAVTTAELTDRDGALRAIDRSKANPERVESVLSMAATPASPLPTA